MNSQQAKQRFGIIGNSPKLARAIDIALQVAPTDISILIVGESGTGKELIANCIFQHSLRSSGSFMAVNCAAIPENLIESELFGHEKGSFTGATSQRIGKFEQCDRGTIFLDEIGDMSLATQTKILRVLQDGEIQRVGGSETIKVDVRVLAATNKDLETMVREKEFREDLYYRLNVFRIRVPSLRERQEDVPDIVDFMLQKLVNERKAKATRLSDEAMATLSKYSWPGNVRELGNVVYHSAVVAQGGIILVKDLPDTLLAGGETEPVVTQSSIAPVIPVASDNIVTGDFDAASPVTPISEELPSLHGTFDFVYEEVKAQEGKRILTYIEKEMIQRAIADTGGNQARAAEILGITRNTLKKRLDDFARDT